VHRSSSVDSKPGDKPAKADASNPPPLEPRTPAEVGRISNLPVVRDVFGAQTQHGDTTYNFHGKETSASVSFEDDLQLTMSASSRTWPQQGSQ
jgi:hypothetical protein